MALTTHQPVRASLGWIGRHELGSVLSVLVLALGALVFGRVAAEVIEGDADALDTAILVGLRDPADRGHLRGPAWLESGAIDVTAFGSVTALTLATVAAVGLLLLLRRPRAAAFVAASITGVAILSSLLKLTFARARPDLVPHLVEVDSASFPSGHAMVSSAVYLSLGAELARFQQRFVSKAYVLLWACLLAVLVGVSRVMVGVHWPTDVLGGWAAGSAWAALGSILTRFLQRRGVLEPPVRAAVAGEPPLPVEERARSSSSARS